MIIARKLARRRLAWLWAAGFILAVSPWTVSAERPPARRFLPDTTVVLVSVTDVPEMVERFKNTAEGRMGRDSNLKPLWGNLSDSLTEATAELEPSVGLSLDDLLAIPQDEVSVAIVIPDETQPADTGDRESNEPHRKTVQAGLPIVGLVVRAIARVGRACPRPPTNRALPGDPCPGRRDARFRHWAATGI